jgi:hypothetical protein
MIPKRQHGMTMWSAAFVIAVVVFFLFLLFKLLPPYLEDLKIKTALDGLASEPGAGAMTKAELVSHLAKRFDIDYVTNVQARQLGVDVRGNSKILRMNYEIVVPLAYNVSALLEFNHERQVTGAE